MVCPEITTGISPLFLIPTINACFVFCKFEFSHLSKPLYNELSNVVTPVCKYKFLKLRLRYVKLYGAFGNRPFPTDKNSEHCTDTFEFSNVFFIEDDAIEDDTLNGL